MLTSQIQIVMPAHVNPQNRLFGGQLMAWIDVVGAVEASRHTNLHVTTVSVDHLEFLAPADLGDLISMEAHVTWSGRTSLEVQVDSYVESLDGSKKQINRAFLVFVALDENRKPTTFPSFVPSTDREKCEWAQAVKRREERMAIKNTEICV